jgi:hypothetical protein
VAATVSEDDMNRARRLYLSAYHPDTGQLQNIIGRMSFQLYGGTILCGAMLVFYKFVTHIFI